MEFGVFQGHSIQIISEKFFDRNVVGFDSFEGLPENWRPGFAKGSFDCKGQLPLVRTNVTLIKGWFNKTIPNWLKNNKNNISFVHIDCDLYSSTKTILSLLVGRISSGTVIVFDEFFNYPGWQDGEFKAFMEWVKDNGVNYDYIALMPSDERVAIKIL